MGAGGGTFLVMNKVLPGAYINFVSQPRAMASLGARGTVAGLLNLSWGPQGVIVTVDAGEFQTNTLNIFGFSFTSPELLYIRELFLGARTLKYYRPLGGTTARATHGSLTITALYNGSRGNDIRLTIENDIDDDTYYFATTLIDVEGTFTAVDTQRVRNIGELTANSFVRFSGSGTLTETAGITLTGGTDPVVTGNDHSMFLGLIEKEVFTTLYFSGTDRITKGLYAAFTKRLREAEGYKITCVLHDYSRADHEGIISVKNNVLGESKSALTYWVAGRQAGCEINRSLTNRIYNGNLTVAASYSTRELETAVTSGEFILYSTGSEIRVVKDINSFTSFRPTKNRDFSSNQVIRVLDEIGNSTARIFNTYYLGQTQNNVLGRDIFKAELIKYNDQLQAIEAIQNFEADDITVTQGREKGDVVTEQYVEPVSAMEKLFMTVRVV